MSKTIWAAEAFHTCCMFVMLFPYKVNDAIKEYRVRVERVAERVASKQKKKTKGKEQIKSY